MPELQQMLKAEGIFGGVAIQESADIPELAALFASFAGGLTGVAAVLRAFFGRHKNRSILVERGGTSYQLKGMSQKDMEALVDRLLETASSEQSEIEHLYRDIPGMEDMPGE